MGDLELICFFTLQSPTKVALAGLHVLRAACQHECMTNAGIRSVSCAAGQPGIHLEKMLRES